MDHYIDSKRILQGASTRGSLCRFLKPDYRKEYIINMKIETQEQAASAIERFYSDRAEPQPNISNIRVLHSDSATCTIRFQTDLSPDPVTIKVVAGVPTLLV